MSRNLFLGRRRYSPSPSVSFLPFLSLSLFPRHEVALQTQTILKKFTDTHGGPLPFLPLHSPLSLHSPCLPLPAPSSSLRSRFPLFQLGNLGERQNRFWCIFSLEIWHLVATILTIFLIINWPYFIPSPADYVKWFIMLHNLTFKDAQINFNDTQFV